ncbi:MAG: J domain-containing protein [Cyanobacterium sp. T60_A2020_053]|nr:J domain-containing protein [Cyanobacterium sp. T60_A2020_053]
MKDLTIEECYQILELDPNTNLAEIEQHYFKFLGNRLKQGEKQELELIKQAYKILSDYYYYQQEQQEKLKQKSYELDIAKKLNHNLRGSNFKVKVRANFTDLEILIKNCPKHKKNTAINLIYHSLKSDSTIQQNLIKIYALKSDNSYFWQEEINFKKGENYSNNGEILLSEAERKTNTYFIPIAFLIAFGMSFANFLTWFIGMWIHEFGHATIAWFSGYRAMITFGATITALEKSNFVYFGILFLIGLTFYNGWKEDKKSTMIVCVIFAIIQFILTWMVGYRGYTILMAWGGIGGEFYLSTLLIIAFYWRLPEKFYWDFWRFGAVIIGAITFCSSFVKWHSIKVGKADIPWGTLWGGRGDSGGDLNILNDYGGWSANQIIGTYINLSNLCLLIVVIFYLFNLLKSHPELPLKLRQFFVK